MQGPVPDASRIPAVSSEEIQPIFRAVTGANERRGIRLERIYWQGLRKVADAMNASVGEFIDGAAASYPGSGNLTSLLRVLSLKWFSSRLGQLEAITAPDNVNSIIQASPAPAFALTIDKRILFYNQSFLALIQTRFLTINAEIRAKGLRLTLDTPVEQLVDALRHKNNKPTTTGFALGVGDQRIRGEINAVLAPTDVQTMVIAFISRT